MIRRQGESVDLTRGTWHSTLVVRSMTGETQSTASGSTGPRRTGSGVRAFLDAALCLYIAVILFRTFELEGYIISTGSMAPSLLGFHKRVVCPSCGYHFPFGIPVDIPGAAADTTGSEALHESLPHPARCDVRIAARMRSTPRKSRRITATNCSSKRTRTNFAGHADGKSLC